MRTAIDQYIINNVREMRIAKKMLQADIAYGLGFESFNKAACFFLFQLALINVFL